VQDRRDGEEFSRLRVVPAIEVHADMLAEGTLGDGEGEGEDEGAAADGSMAPPRPAAADVNTTTTTTTTATSTPNVSTADVSSILAAADPVAAIAQKTGLAVQTMTLDEIETLKREGATDAGRELVARLLSSHTALDRKTAFARAKYRLLKVKKYLRRFAVLPLHVATLAHWMLCEREAVKIMDVREETLALLGCWANVHFAEAADAIGGGKRRREEEEEVPGGGDVEMEEEGGAEGGRQRQETSEQQQQQQQPLEGADEASTSEPTGGGRWLVVDDTGGLLVASMAERMGILYPPAPGEQQQEEEEEGDDDGDHRPGDDGEADTEANAQAVERMQLDSKEEEGTPLEQPPPTEPSDPSQPPPPPPPPPSNPNDAAPPPPQRPPPWHHQRNHSHNMALTNTLTVVHTNAQPSLHVLRYYNYDVATPPTRPPYHPLARHLLPLSWLQLLEPESDPIYAARPEPVAAHELAAWKASRKSTYFRKLRRWNRLAHIVDSARAGGFAGLAVASTMDAVSILRHALPLLAPGAPVAVYSPTLEPLAQLADLFSTARRAAWSQAPPVGGGGGGGAGGGGGGGPSLRDLERWPGSDDFPLNPTLLLGATVQTSRARRWQVLPGRTHPVMTAKGGCDGFVFTGWKAVPAEGRVQARGKYKRRKLNEER
jgi:tRNA (adenine-N(1)-)-methyltransferase non-catalytic subunit